MKVFLQQSSKSQKVTKRSDPFWIMNFKKPKVNILQKNSVTCKTLYDKLYPSFIWNTLLWLTCGLAPTQYMDI